ncbi:MAG: hypothetical protein JW940_15155 [Polyangiaceae bacterium]|nr:hypothetical protein [Polyangiaceae bacterium]
MHAFDRWLGRQTLGFTAAATALAAGVVMLTDEAGSSAGMRVARVAALAPGLAALGGCVALSQASSRGELRALAALGANPWRAGWGVSVAGWLIGAAAALVLCTTWVDASALFPAVPASATWAADGATFIEPFAGVRVLPEGSFRALEAVRPRGRGGGPGPVDALLGLAPLAAILPVWVVAPLASRGRAAVAALTGALLILLLHLVAGGQVPRIVLVLASAPLAVQATSAVLATRRH